MFPIVDPNSNIDFYAGNNRSLSLLLPLWEAMGNRRGTFYANRRVKSTGVMLSRINGRQLDGIAPLIVCSHEDLRDVYIIGEERPFILFEKEFTNKFNGLMRIVSLFVSTDKKAYGYRRTINRDNAFYVKDEKEAAATIVEWVAGKEAELVTEIEGKSIGLIYMAFGQKALHAVHKSVASLHRKGYSYPVTVVGDFDEQKESKQFNYVKWTGESPFDKSQRKNFQFRAGRVKPFLYQYSPYDYTLYLDADTIFLRPIHDVFPILNEYDFIVTEETLSLEQLYNKKLAGWEINIEERDRTVKEIGGDAKQKFINSGVFLFKKNKNVAMLFKDWYREWLRFEQWDEQLALTRSIYRHPKVSVKRLPVQYNDPSPNHQSYIFHNYGRGSVRTNYEVV